MVRAVVSKVLRGTGFFFFEGFLLKRPRTGGDEGLGDTSKSRLGVRMRRGGKAKSQGGGQILMQNHWFYEKKIYQVNKHLKSYFKSF